ncbi:MAG: type IV pilus assembly protein PilM [Chitinophagales bacterium]
MFRSENRLIGLDLGSSAVKIACVRSGARGWDLMAAGQGRLPEGVIDETGVNDPDIVSHAIQEALGAAGLRRVRRVVVGVPSRYLTVRVLTVPTMDHSELREAAKWEASQYIPYPVEEGVFDFLELGPGAATGTLDVLSISARKTVIDSIVKAAELAGLEPVALDAAPLASGRALLAGAAGAAAAAPGLKQAAATHDGPVGEEAVALVDIGYSSSDVSIFRGQQLRVARSIPIGGARFTAAVAEALGIDPDAAEARKQSEVRLDVEEPPLIRLGKPTADQAAYQVAEELADELQRSLDYFRAQSRWMPTHRLVLTGGGSHLQGMDAFLAERLNIEVVRGESVLAGLDTRLAAGISPVALGLALWEVTVA